MQIGLYVIYDKTAEEAGPVFQAVNTGIALRGAVKSLHGLPKPLREEYALYQVGIIDTKTMFAAGLPEPIEIDMSISFARADEQVITEVK